MRVKKVENVTAENYAQGVRKRKVISEKDGTKNFDMRVFEVEPGAPFPPPHRHPWEHQIYILEGQGVVVGEDGEKPFRSGDAIFIPPDEEHQLKQHGALRFI
jgi:quercetin dioxygenase-like cupin family protein